MVVVGVLFVLGLTVGSVGTIGVSGDSDDSPDVPAALVLKTVDMKLVDVEVVEVEEKASSSASHDNKQALAELRSPASEAERLAAHFALQVEPSSVALHSASHAIAASQGSDIAHLMVTGTQPPQSGRKPSLAHAVETHVAMVVNRPWAGPGAAARQVAIQVPSSHVPSICACAAHSPIARQASLVAHVAMAALQSSKQSSGSSVGNGSLELLHVL